MMTDLDTSVSFFNAAVMGFVAAISFWLALDERFKTRIVITLGLGVMSLGAGAEAFWQMFGLTCTEVIDSNRAAALLNLGLLIVVCGYLHRMFRPEPKHPERRRSDFMELDATSQRHATGGRKS